MRQDLVLDSASAKEHDVHCALGVSLQAYSDITKSCAKASSPSDLSSRLRSRRNGKDWWRSVRSVAELGRTMQDAICGTIMGGTAGRRSICGKVRRETRVGSEKQISGEDLGIIGKTQGGIN